MTERDLRQGRRDFFKVAGGGMGALAVAAPPLRAQAAPPPSGAARFDVTAFGAIGDGKTIASPAINRALEAASAAGGGTVHVPAGQYLCYSIHLQSNVTLYLDHGAVIIAADPLPPGQPGGYDDPGPAQPWEAYQDFGHNHWRNSLIWGIGLENVSILGPGRIYGRGLSRANGPDSRDPAARRIQGVANKSISLKNCHNVLLRDFQILQGGWFGILATGVDNFVVDNLLIDTNRDGMDIDCCWNVRVTNCSVNSPWDDAIVLKSSYALGAPRPTKNVALSNNYVTGVWQLGTMLDGTRKGFGPNAPHVSHTGRIKFGTESNGGFQNINITNCAFEGCQGLAIETVDGALLEDITISNITMRHIITAPIFMRLGRRLRGPAATTHPGALRRVTISNVVCSNAASEWGCIISGIPGFPIEDVKLSDIYIQQRGGGTAAQAAIEPPENASGYPEPTMFGHMPSQGMFIRHARNLEVSGFEVAAMTPDVRPGFVLEDVDGVDLFHIKTPAGAKPVELRSGTNVTARWVRGLNDGAVS